MSGLHREGQGVQGSHPPTTRSGWDTQGLNWLRRSSEETQPCDPAVARLASGAGARLRSPADQRCGKGARLGCRLGAGAVWRPVWAFPHLPRPAPTSTSTLVLPKPQLLRIESKMRCIPVRVMLP